LKNCHTQNKWSTKHSPFLLKVLQCIVIINQSFTIKLKWPIETNSKTAQRRILREALNTHGLARNHIDNGSITRFQELGAVFQLFPRTKINLLLQFSKLAGNVSCVAIPHRCVTNTDLARIVQDNHLSCKASWFHGWVIFAITSHNATPSQIC
uniref:Uncharacterized protein n=1 Tax=Sus scrofa TaxID=9823 RepID=A0A4X1V7C3_PIG